MSDIVKDIREGFEAQIALSLPTFSVLQNKFDLEANNFINQDLRYGVVILDGTRPPEGILSHYTIDRNIEVILVQKYIKGLNNDSVQQTSVNTLESAMDDIAKDAVANKLGVPNLVFDVSFEAISAPDFSIENVTILRGTFIVKYRTRITASC